MSLISITPDLQTDWVLLVWPKSLSYMYFIPGNWLSDLSKYKIIYCIWSSENVCTLCITIVPGGRDIDQYRIHEFYAAKLSIWQHNIALSRLLYRRLFKLMLLNTEIPRDTMWSRPDNSHKNIPILIIL